MIFLNGIIFHLSEKVANQYHDCFNWWKINRSGAVFNYFCSKIYKLVAGKIKWALSSEFVSSSIPSWQILTAHAQPFRGARDLAFCLKVPLDSLLIWASSQGSGETARMRRLAWTFAARIGYKYQIRLKQSKWKLILCNECKYLDRWALMQTVWIQIRLLLLNSMIRVYTVCRYESFMDKVHISELIMIDGNFSDVRIFRINRRLFFSQVNIYFNYCAGLIYRPVYKGKQVSRCRWSNGGRMLLLQGVLAAFSKNIE